MMDLNRIKKDLGKAIMSHQLAVDTVRREKIHLKEARQKLECALEAQQIIQEVAKNTQERVHTRIASLVSRCLHSVFGSDSYDFVIRFVKSRGRTEARLLLVRGDLEVEPTEASGGGVVDVCSFGLRIAALLLSRPARRKLLLLDEPFKHLSAEYVPAARDLIEALSEELEVQMLMVTHREGLEVGKVIRLE